MKRVTLILLLLAVAALAGCFHDPVEEIDAFVALVYDRPTLRRPQMTGVDDWYVHPGAKEWLNFNSDFDAFGNRTGVPSREWSIDSVTIRCSEKAINDTVFPTDDPNFWYWVPGWTGAIDGLTGWPHAPAPNIPYTIYDACGDNGVFNQGAPAQTATIVALAHTKRIYVRFTAPEIGNGKYVLDQIVGFAPTSSNVIEIWIAESGDYSMTWTDGEDVRVWQFKVPEDWFWLRWEGDIPVGAIGSC